MLGEQLSSDLKAAMKSRDKVRLAALRQAMSAVKYAQIAKQASLDDTEVLGVIAKEAKKRRESIEEFGKGNRPDLVEVEEAELAILIEYLPQQMSREEIMATARQIIEEVAARGPGDKGKVMPKIVAQLKGKAGGREINEVVTELLNN